MKKELQETERRNAFYNLARENKLNAVKCENEKGITLIVLVVTIIVLLILAGVSITTVLGEDGIIAQAKLAAARTKEEEAQAQEDLNKLSGEMQNWLNGETEEPSQGGATTKPSTSTSPSPEPEPSPSPNEPSPSPEPEFDGKDVTIGEPMGSEHYGEVVKNYNTGSEVWRLFYQDENYTYIISDALTNEASQTASHIADYPYGSRVSEIGRYLNPLLKDKGTYFTSTVMTPNVRAVAWLTDPEQWTKYKSEDALYAIGSPTFELFAKSYNAGNFGNRITVAEDTTKKGYEWPMSSSWSEGTGGGIYTAVGISYGYWLLASPDRYGRRWNLYVCRFSQFFNATLVQRL